MHLNDEPGRGAAHRHRSAPPCAASRSGSSVPGTEDETPAGAEGEIRIAGPCLMRGYAGDGLESPIRDGWLRTGDLGRFDGDGYLSVTGRLKDLIVRGGENLSPRAIEDTLGGPSGRRRMLRGRWTASRSRRSAGGLRRAAARPRGGERRGAGRAGPPAPVANPRSCGVPLPGIAARQRGRQGGPQGAASPQHAAARPGACAAARSEAEFRVATSWSGGEWAETPSRRGVSGRYRTEATVLLISDVNASVRPSVRARMTPSWSTNT